MAPLLSRLFSNKKPTKNNVSHKLLEETQKSQHQVRALLFRECDWRGRKLLFDSKTVRKKDISSKNNGCVSSKEARSTKLANQSSSNCKPPVAPIKVQLCATKTSGGSSENATVYEYLKPSPDVKMLGEMLFGSVAMSFWGSTTKIHTIRSPPQLMISVVFPTPITSTQRLRDFDNSGSLQNSISERLIPKCQENEEFSSMAHSVPVDVPGRFSVSSRELSFNTSDSFNSTLSSGTTSLFFSPDSASSSLNSSYSSFQRRWLRNFNTNIECGRSRRSDEMSSVDESKINGQRRVKLGLAIVFSLGESLRDENSFRNFFFSHIALIEGRISKLMDVICNAYLNKDNFVHVVYEGTMAFRSSIRDLYSTPRLANPMWLTVASPSSNHHPQLKKFFTEFLSLIRQFDTKQTHFFVSTLLTAVLTHHLGWVSTVQPNENIPVENFKMKESAPWLDQLAKSHPYNPLWIQLGDLYGATGFPSKVSQTVVLGKSAETILKFLRVLSYFIRCSDVYERIQDGDVMQESPRHTKLFNASSQSDSVGVITKRDGIKCFQVEDVLKKTTRVNCTCLHLKASLPSIEDILPNEGSVIFLLGDSPSKVDLNSPSNIDLDNTKCSNELRNLEISESDNCASGGTDSLGYGSLGNIIDSSNVKENQSSSFQESCLWCTNHDRINVGEYELEAVPETNGENFNEPLSICLTPTAANIPGVVPASSNVKIDTELSNEINVSSPEELSRTKLYIREYCTLRFRSIDALEGDPVVESAVRSCTLKEAMALTTNKGDDNEAPEEGYQSMDDTHATSGKGLGQLVETLFTQLPPATKEYPLPRLQSIDVDKISDLQTGFGWSLMASLTDHYLTDFCLQGVLGNVSDETVYKELCSSVKASVLGEPTSAAICLIADTDTWSVKICSSSGLLFGNRKVSACMSPLVAEILDALCQMSHLNMSTEFCLMHLENCLQELLFRSRSLAAILTEEPDSPLEKAVSLLAIDTNDLPLLISIATTHSPQLSSFNRC